MAIELTRLAGRSRPSLTSATITGVIAVAITVPACQILETSVAAATAEIAAIDQRADVEPAAAAGGAGAGGGEPLRRGGAVVRRECAGCDDIEVRLRPASGRRAGLARRGGTGEASPLL